MSDNGELKPSGYKVLVLSNITGHPTEMDVSDIGDEQLRRMVRNGMQRLNVLKAEAETLMNDLYQFRVEAVRRGWLTDDEAEVDNAEQNPN